MAYLLDLAGHPEGRCIMPHSLNATAISSLMTEVVKGNPNLPQLAIIGNYRAGAPQDVCNIYSRNVANQHLSVSNFAQSAFCANKKPESIKIDPPALSGNTCQNSSASSESKTQRFYDWAPNHLGVRENPDLRKLCGGGIAFSFA